MRRTILGLMAAAGLIASASTASAQHNRNVITASGNGINNTIVVQNHHHSYPGFGPAIGPPSQNFINNSGNGIGNTIIAKNVTGFPSYGGGYSPGYVSGYGPSYGGSFNPFPGGVNVNVVTNSGNGIGNTILTGNSGAPGGLNINVITNSGNGQGNTIVTRNR